MPSDVQILTYDDLAGRLGITRESARQLVIRKRWTRTKGNDGRARVHVPLEALEAARTSATGSDTQPDTGPATSDTPSDTRADPFVITVLTRHIERLETALGAADKRIAGLEEERDAERARAADRDALAGRIEALNAIVEAAKGREEELRAERDAEHSRAVECDVLTIQVETLKVALEEARRDRDKWAVQAHALAHPLVPPTPAPMPSRGLLGWFRAARR